MLPDMDIAGQDALLAAKVLIIGLGGLGAPAALYLASSGVGELVLCDDDTVELSNLQRQIIHSETSIGINKAQSASARLTEINSTIKVTALPHRLDAQALTQQLQDITLVLDCTDNFETRFMINDTCWAAGVPVVSGAAIRTEGQVALFDPTADDAPCYRCLYAEGDDNAMNCAENGILAPVVGMIGLAQALEAVKFIAGIGPSSAGFVHYFDAKYFEWRKLTLTPRAHCPTCG